MMGEGKQEHKPNVETDKLSIGKVLESIFIDYSKKTEGEEF